MAKQKTRRCPTNEDGHKCDTYLVYTVIFGRPIWECWKCGKQRSAV